jgi:hemoglobin
MQNSLISKENIALMVREFYAIILKDEMLNPYFTKPLGTDLTNEKWQAHFDTLDSFWLTMMTSDQTYKGSPFPPHKLIGTLYLETFERWLELFSATVHKYYIPEIADSFYEKADVMAQFFIKKLKVKNMNDTEEGK